jgi:hypothetical protein
MADFCCYNRINLLFVRHTAHPKDLFFQVYEQAKKMEPCVVYISNATRLFNDSMYTKEFIAAYTSVITSATMNVWTVLSGSYPPKMLLLHSKHSAHPVYNLLEQNGDVVHVPCVNDIEEASRVAVEFLRELTEDRDYIPSDYRSHFALLELINHMARAFLFHTMSEIRAFLRDIISKHNIECVLSKSRIRTPPHSIFTAALARLPTAESCGQHYRKLYTRDVYAEHNDQTIAWSAFMELTAPPIECNYTPSIDSDYVPASISSPSREYDPTEVLPRSAPVHRPAKRERDPARTYQSHKPLPAPKRSALSYFRSRY